MFSKTFDHCIISCEDAALKSDDLQFAYKSGMSTIQCASVVTETINNYLHNKSDIYMCTIDASKAFDRVTLFVLFNFVVFIQLNKYIISNIRLLSLSCCSTSYTDNDTEHGGSEKG